MISYRNTQLSDTPERGDICHLYYLSAIEACKRELQETQRLLKDARARYTCLYDAAPLAFITLDNQGIILEMNEASATLLGNERAYILGQPLTTWLTDDNKLLFLEQLQRAFCTGARINIELTLKISGRNTFEAHLDGIIVAGNDQSNVCRTVMTNLSAGGEAEQDFGLASRVIESVAEGIMITNAQHKILSVNQAFEKSTGYSAQEVIGKSPAILHSGRHDENFYQEMWATLDKHGQWQGEVWNRRKSGEIYPEWLSISAVKNSKQYITHYVGIFSDAHTQTRILERLHYLAYYDGLTGLPNRHLFLDRLHLTVSQARRDKRQLAVMFVDLDNFKRINDTLGHNCGDAVLMAITERMKGCLRDGDTLARLGGDEFTVILPAIAHADTAINVARKLLDSCAIPLSVGGNSLQMTASIGISIFPDDGSEGHELLNHADMAMYKIKHTGRNGYWCHKWKHVE